MGEIRDFGSSEALLAHIKEKSDDIEKAVIPTSPVQITTPGEPDRFMRVGMLLHLVGRQPALISREDAEVVLNDGILNRMRIKIEIRGID